LNPSTENSYDGLYKFPRSGYTDEYKREDWIVATGESIIPPGLIDGWESPKNYTIAEEGITSTIKRHYRIISF
jgi:hypothetical protein